MRACSAISCRCWLLFWASNWFSLFRATTLRASIVISGVAWPGRTPARPGAAIYRLSHNVLPSNFIFSAVLYIIFAALLETFAMLTRRSLTLQNLHPAPTKNLGPTDRLRKHGVYNTSD